MSSFTNFLNLFKWNPIEDGEEEFDIDRALNDNWDKIDTKLETHIADTNSKINEFETDINSEMENFKNGINRDINTLKNETDETINNFEIETNSNIETFKEEINENISNYESNVNQTVQDLRNSINSTQEFYKYTLTIAETTETGAKITLPCYYKVGQDVLDVYLNGERVILSSDETGTDGHYQEVGELDSISNKIKTTTDWNLEAGDVLDLVVRGDYCDTES